jgi:F0F1-type ATP synthase membrane subunit c/vacuolar-type H+-ATPase subunit K
MILLEAVIEAVAIVGFVFGLIAFVRTERFAKTLK